MVSMLRVQQERIKNRKQREEQSEKLEECKRVTIYAEQNNLLLSGNLPSHDAEGASLPLDCNLPGSDDRPSRGHRLPLLPARSN